MIKIFFRKLKTIILRKRTEFIITATKKGSGIFKYERK